MMSSILLLATRVSKLPRQPKDGGRIFKLLLEMINSFKLNRSPIDCGRIINLFLSIFRVVSLVRLPRYIQQEVDGGVLFWFQEDKT